MRPTTLLRGATALALLTLLSGHAGAHERWVRHELLSPFDRDLFEVAGPVNLGLLALALVIVTLVSLVARRVQDPRPSSEPVTPLRDLALAILGLTYGVGCVLATAKGEYLAPDLIGDGSTLGLVVVQGAGLTGALLALGLFTRPAAWASLGLFALAVVLLLGGVIGAQFGTSIGARMKAEQLRILLALLVLAVCGKLALDLLLPPAELYEIGTGT